MDKARSKKRQLKQSGKNAPICYLPSSITAACYGRDGNKARNFNCLGKLNSSNQDTEMGGESQGEEEVPRRSIQRCKSNSKKFKFHSKSFVDRNAVDHAKVPRKLRSAMIKRSRESLSPPLSYVKKPQHTSVGMEATPVNGTKKFKPNLKEESQVSVPITKDEEEVARTLFSLARMLPNEKPVVSRVDCLAQKISPIQDKDVAQLASEGSKEESTLSQLTSSAAEHASASDAGGGPSKQNSVAGPPVMGPPAGYGRTKSDLALSGSGALVDLFRTSLSSMGANRDAMPLVDPSELGVSSEFCHAPRSVPKHEVSHCEQKLDYGLWPATNAIKREESQQHGSMRKGNGALLACIQGAPYLWPGMYRVQSCGGEVCGPSSWPYTNKLPSRLVDSPRTPSTETNNFTEQVKPVVVDQRHTKKRCPTHVYISRLIQAHQTSERIKLGVTPTNNLISLSTEPNNLQEKMPHQQEQLTSVLSSDKKKGDFLSLSAGGSDGGGLDPIPPIPNMKRDSNLGGKDLVSSTQGQVSYLPPLMAFSLPSVRSASPQSQIAHYMSSPLYFPGPRWQNGTHGSSSSLVPCGQPSFSSQQQQLFALSSSSYPRSYVDSGGGIQVDATTGLQC